ncbi:hypothetical protein [Paracoccus zhejiangensis]|uniref:hypothetical protein n=1 Tax=Paracoccus zhejiangensis TaxID=1077935 RepID=UPI0018E4C890|nr:hypothetical protein [Paracoccus zhejiangensis]
MIGVVVWSSAERQKAVIWCDDHGALAYLQGPEHLIGQGEWPCAGDLVSLEFETIGDLRHARAVSIIGPQHFPGLPDVLRDVAREEPPLRLVTSNGKRVDQDYEAEEAPADRLRRVAGWAG